MNNDPLQCLMFKSPKEKPPPLSCDATVRNILEGNRCDIKNEAEPRNICRTHHENLEHKGVMRVCRGVEKLLSP